jgi:hypothetical protein
MGVGPLMAVGFLGAPSSADMNFGAGYTGLATVAYKLVGADGTILQNWTTSGVAEAEAGSGIYAVSWAAAFFSMTLAAAVQNGKIRWRTAVGGVIATDDLLICYPADATITSRADASASALVTRNNTAQAGSSNTITLDAGASGLTDFYVGQWAVIASGAGAGQSRLITAYNGATKVATVHANWKTQPSGTSVFYLLAAADIQGVVLADTATTLTNAPADSAGVTTLLTRLSAARAGYLDNLNGIVAAI